jgi:hypothetical protein
MSDLPILASAEPGGPPYDDASPVRRCAGRASGTGWRLPRMSWSTTRRRFRGPGQDSMTSAPGNSGICRVRLIGQSALAGHVRAFGQELRVSALPSHRSVQLVRELAG